MIEDFTKCCYTIKIGRLTGNQCGGESIVKGFCASCGENKYDLNDSNHNNLIIHETYLGKNKIVFDQCLAFNTDQAYLKEIINHDFSYLNEKSFTLPEYSNKLISMDRQSLNDMIMLKIGPIDKITPKVLSFIIYKLFLINCVVEPYDRGILDVKNRFLLHSITLEHYTGIYYKW